MVALAVSCASGQTEEGSDNDGDGYGEGVDCNDNDSTINPDEPERCDGIDNDCDGLTDEDDAIGGTKFWPDKDGDTFGSGGVDEIIERCKEPEGYAPVNGDCNDDDPTIYPGAAENCAEDIDRNCDGSSGYDDIDMDGWPACEECNDMDPAINPDAAEICDGIDNNCDMQIDEGDDDALCGTIANGGAVCLGADGCDVGHCDANFFDTNDDVADGCECLGDPVPVTTGASCATAIDLGNFTDAMGDSTTVTGNSPEADRELWYVFSAIDDGDTNGDEFHVDIRFLTNPGTAYELEVWRGGCPGGSGTVIAAAETDIVEWFTDQNFTTTGCPTGFPSCGEGNCVPTSGQPGRNQCNNDSAAFFVRITRTDSAASCDSYELEIANGAH